MDKKKAVLSLQNQTREQPESRRAVHLLFAPIKKARMEWLIEKSVELGVTDLHPVITHHTEVRDINHERTLAQIIEAAEQCERLDIPHLHELRPLKNVLGDWPKDIPVMIGLERADAPMLGDVLPAQGPPAFLIGPEGGFSAEEKSWPDSLPILKPVSLGADILRAETAACYVLVAASMMKRWIQISAPAKRTACVPIEPQKRPLLCPSHPDNPHACRMRARSSTAPFAPATGSGQA